MTCIAGYTDGKVCAIAADSGAFDGSYSVTVKEPKVWRADNALIGVAGSFRVMEIVRESRLSDAKSIRDLISSSVLIKDGDEWEVIVVKPGGLWYIGGDHSIGQYRNNYLSIGSGAPYAVGALWVASKNGESPAVAVEQAVRAAVEHHTYASLPVKVLTIKPESVVTVPSAVKKRGRVSADKAVPTVSVSDDKLGGTENLI
jgi:ATP-dependent protease HslVU (ClpYQ) peptidase subunit